MSEDAILGYLRSIDERLARLEASCLARRCESAEDAPASSPSRAKGALVKSLAALAAAAAGAIATRYLGQ